VSRYLVLVVGILVVAVCVWLGVWQLDRLGQRKSRNAAIEIALAAPEIDLGAPYLDVDSLQYRRVRARGAFDFEREIVVMARAHDGVPAVHVVTPFRLDDDTAVLVERGWVPSPDGRTVDLLPLRESGSHEVEGVVIPFSSTGAPAAPAEGWPRYVRSANPVELASAYPYALFPIVVRRTEVPPENPSVLRPAPLPELTNGPHFSYAVQWFSFATIALVGCGVLFGKLGVRGKLGTGE
jgi:surfeit locus 1 family protein